MIRIIVFGLTTLSVTGKITWLLGARYWASSTGSRTASLAPSPVLRPGATPHDDGAAGHGISPSDEQGSQSQPQEFGWLAALLAEVATGLRGSLDALLHRPDMVALREPRRSR